MNNDYINNKLRSSISVSEGYYYIFNSIFKNCHTKGSGGIIYSVDNYNMEIDNINVYNTTSIKPVIYL